MSHIIAATETPPQGTIPSGAGHYARSLSR